MVSPLPAQPRRHRPSVDDTHSSAVTVNYGAGINLHSVVIDDMVERYTYAPYECLNKRLDERRDVAAVAEAVGIHVAAAR